MLPPHHTNFRRGLSCKTELWSELAKAEQQQPLRANGSTCGRRASGIEAICNPSNATAIRNLLSYPLTTQQEQ